MSLVGKGRFALSCPGARVAFKDRRGHFAPFCPSYSAIASGLGRARRVGLCGGDFHSASKTSTGARLPTWRTGPSLANSRVRPDGVGVDASIFVEVFAHIGKLRGGQMHKVSTDALKPPSDPRGTPCRPPDPRLRRRGGRGIGFRVEGRDAGSQWHRDSHGLPRSRRARHDRSSPDAAEDGQPQLTALRRVGAAAAATLTQPSREPRAPTVSGTNSQ